MRVRKDIQMRAFACMELVCVSVKERARGGLRLGVSPSSLCRGMWKTKESNICCPESRYQQLIKALVWQFPRVMSDEI